MEKKDFYIDKLVRVVLIVGIAAWVFQVIYPLLDILAWGFILAIILYPFYVWLDTYIRRPFISACIITICVLMFIIGITFVITNDIAHSVRDFNNKIYSSELTLPPPPDSVHQWPIIGEQIHKTWAAASINLKDEIKQNSATLISVGRYALAKAVDTSKNLLLFIIALLFSGYLLVNADSFMYFLKRFAKRVSHKSGTEMINIIRETIKNVSRGVIGISLLQALIFWIILILAQAEGAGLLSLLALILCVAQVGLFILAIPIIIWLFFTKSLLLAVVISILIILTTLLDSFLKPFVLARGLSTPMMIIFIGVLGGILVYGFIGVFLGPVILAIAYNLLLKWVDVELEEK